MVSGGLILLSLFSTIIIFFKLKSKEFEVSWKHKLLCKASNLDYLQWTTRSSDLFACHWLRSSAASKRSNYETASLSCAVSTTRYISFNCLCTLFVWIPRRFWKFGITVSLPTWIWCCLRSISTQTQKKFIFNSAKHSSGANFKLF